MAARYYRRAAARRGAQNSKQYVQRVQVLFDLTRVVRRKKKKKKKKKKREERRGRET
jgi:hypothetical protein